MHRYFHNELDDLRSKLLLMGEKATELVRFAMDGVLESDTEVAERVIRLDDTVDQLEIEIDRDCVRYITLRAPVASDLRLLFVAIKASHDFERVGDEATSIAKRTLKMLQQVELIRDFHQIPPMSELAIGMLNDAMQCFIGEDRELAGEIITRDKQVDAMNLENHRTFSERMMADPDLMPACIEAIFISKSLERVADHAKNLAEEVTYLLGGGERPAPTKAPEA